MQRMSFASVPHGYPMPPPMHLCFRGPPLEVSGTCACFLASAGRQVCIRSLSFALGVSGRTTVLVPGDLTRDALAASVMFPFSDVTV